MKKLIYFLSCTGFVILGFFAVALLKGMFKQTTAAGWLSIACDAVAIPSVIMLCVGVISWIGKSGTFDMISYGFKSLGVMFTPSKRAFENRQTFYEFKEQKDINGRKWFPEFIIWGAFYIGVSFLVLIAYLIVR